MGLFSWFRPSGPLFPSFEKALQELELRIQSNREHLAAIKARERYAVVTVTFYALAVWAVYVGMWWMGWVKGKVGWFLGLEDGGGQVAKLVEAMPVWAVPLGVIFIRRLFHWWYQRKQYSEQKQLHSLQKQLRDKVEELKKQTSYYSTRELLERYDDKVRKNTEAGRRPGVPFPGGGPQNATPGGIPRRGQAVSTTAVPPSLANMTPGPQAPRSPMTPGSRGWADRFADALLGGDEGGADNKYALICVQCFAHNGLVLQEELYELQYKCPRCNHLNPPKPRPAGYTPPRTSALSPTSSAPTSTHRRRSSPGQPRRSSLHQDSPLSSNSNSNVVRRPTGLQSTRFPSTDQDRGGDEDEEGEGDVSLGRISPTEMAFREGEKRKSSVGVLSKKKGKEVERDEDAMDED